MRTHAIASCVGMYCTRRTRSRLPLAPWSTEASHDVVPISLPFILAIPLRAAEMAQSHVRSVLTTLGGGRWALPFIKFCGSLLELVALCCDYTGDTVL